MRRDLHLHSRAERRREAPDRAMPFVVAALWVVAVVLGFVVLLAGVGIVMLCVVP